MKFDVVIGNPPYQDGRVEGGQNKIYNQISEKSYNSTNAIIAFITPTSILKKSKRSKIYSKKGLKFVSFDVNKYFSVGSDICYWIIDKEYSGKVEIKEINGTRFEEQLKPIYSISKIDENFLRTYLKLKEATDKPNKRMFHQNIDRRSFFKTAEYKYPVYKIEKGTPKLVQYNIRKPYVFQKTKIVIPLTKTLNEQSIFVSDLDFDVNYMFIEMTDSKQFENIKSFILSDYFKKHSENWKMVDANGFNNSVKYLPPFNINKKWTNEDVKRFIEEQVK